MTVRGLELITMHGITWMINGPTMQEYIEAKGTVYVYNLYTIQQFKHHIHIHFCCNNHICYDTTGISVECKH